MKYRVLFPTSCLEDKFYKMLAKLPRKSQDAVMEATSNLTDDPYPQGKNIFNPHPFQFIYLLQDTLPGCRHTGKMGNWLNLEFMLDFLYPEKTLFPAGSKCSVSNRDEIGIKTLEPGQDIKKISFLFPGFWGEKLER